MTFTDDQLEIIAQACAMMRAMAAQHSMGMEPHEIEGVVADFTDIISLIETERARTLN